MKIIRKKKKVAKKISEGRICIQVSYNNTLVTATDLNGNLLAWSSAGSCGFKGPRKATPFAASVVIKNLAEKVQDIGLRDVHVFVKGIGGGRESSIRSLNASGFNVLSILDVTPIPHNGPKRPRPRKM